MNNNLIWIKINTDKYYNLLIKLNDIGVSIYDNKRINNHILIKINKKDYKKINKYLINYKIKIYSESGINRIINIIKYYKFFFISFLIGIIFLLLLNIITIKIDIKSSNKRIQKLILKELNKNGINNISLKRSHKKIEVIVNKILDDNKNEIEFLEISYDGLVLVVNVTERINFNEVKNYKYCDIISNKEAKITSIYLERGIALKKINDYVFDGDVIISGDIIHNEEVKNRVCAKGKIYGEVWYKVNVEVPLKESIKKYTNKYRYNISIRNNDNNYKIFKSRLKNYNDEIINIYKLNDFEININKEKEYVYETKKLTLNKAYNKGIKLAVEKINKKLNKNEEILYKKVLKKEVNNSTIYLVVFIVTKEEIGVVNVKEE